MTRLSTGHMVRSDVPSHVDITGALLIERHAPWRLVREAMRTAGDSAGCVVLIEGTSGLGKSDLMLAVEEAGRAANMEVLSACGRRHERDFSFGVVLSLFESRLAEASEEERGRLLSAAARHALPLFEPGPRSGMSDASFELLHGVYWLCVNLTRSRPLLIAVDDAHLADEASLRFLLYLGERLADLPVVLVLASAPTTGRSTPPLLSELARHRNTRRTTLRPLTPDGTAHRVREAWIPGADENLCRAIHDATEGNPLLVDKLAAQMARADDLEATGTAVRRPAPASIAELALGLADDAGPGGRAMLTAVATLGPHAEPRLVAALAGLGVEEAAAVVDRLLELGVLRGERILSFTAPIVAAAIAEVGSPRERAARHSRAAALLAQDGASPEEVAAQLEPSAHEGRAWAVETLIAAAGVALGRGAPHDAVRYLRRALEEPPPKALRAHVVLELGRAEAMAGEPQAVATLSRAATEPSLEPADARSALDAGRALVALGRPAEARTVLELGLRHTDDENDELAPWLEASIATTRVLGPGGAPAMDRTPPATADTPGDRALLALHAMEGVLHGRPAEEVRRLARLALGRGALLDQETSDGVTYYLAASAMAFAEDLTTAEAALTAAVDEAQARGSVLGFANASHVRAVAILLRGRVNDAATDARQALAVERHGWRFDLAGARIVLATCLMERGELESAGEQLAAADGEADSPLTQAALLMTRARFALLSGDLEAALDGFLACEHLGERAGIDNPAVLPWRSSAALAAYHLGRSDEANAWAEQELALAERFGAPGAIGRALRVLGTVRGPDAGLDLLTAAVSRLEQSQAALERARAFVELGVSLRRAGRRRDAREPLALGADLAVRCGAEALAKTARAEAVLAGARPRRTAVTGVDALTPRERQVCALAVRGLSNREIADRLVVTVKTVEWHLKHSYRKLEVDSRKRLRELAPALDAEDAA